MTRPREDALHEHVGAIVRSARDGLDLLRGVMPEQRNKIQAVVSSVQDALLTVEQLLASWATALKTREHPTDIASVCHLLRHTEDVVHSLDELCRQHHVRLEIAASVSLPAVSGMPERIVFVLLALLEYVIRLAMPESVVKVRLMEAVMRHGTGMEWRVVAKATSFTERDRYQLFEVLGMQQSETARTMHEVGDLLFDRLAICRSVVDSMRGELWVEHNTPGTIELVMLLPAVQPVTSTEAPSRCKLDIVVRNAAVLTTEYGRIAVLEHLQTLEALVSKVVRSPRDTLMLFEPRGVISVMMHTTTEYAQIVSARIQRAIGEAQLATMGIAPVEYDFRVAPIP